MSEKIMDIMDLMDVIGVDISTLPDQSVKIFVGCEPKVKCRNKFLQKIFTKVFGVKGVYETRQAKVVTISAEDLPKGYDSTLEITFGENTDCRYILYKKVGDTY